MILFCSSENWYGSITRNEGGIKTPKTGSGVRGQRSKELTDKNIPELLVRMTWAVTGSPIGNSSTHAPCIGHTPLFSLISVWEGGMCVCIICMGVM